MRRPSPFELAPSASIKFHPLDRLSLLPGLTNFVVHAVPMEGRPYGRPPPFLLGGAESRDSLGGARRIGSAVTAREAVERSEGLRGIYAVVPSGPSPSPCVGQDPSEPALNSHRLIDRFSSAIRVELCRGRTQWSRARPRTANLVVTAETSVVIALAGPLTV